MKKKLAKMLLGLVKKYLSSSRGQKRVDGVANMFKMMVVTAEMGYDEQLDEARETQDQIDELLALSNQQDHELAKAKRLIGKLQEITD
jgi:predicted transcriptional regulator